MKMKAGSYFLIVILAITLFVVLYSLTFTSLKLKLLPLATSGFIFVLAAIELGRELKKKEQAKELKADEIQDNRSQLKNYIIVFSWIVGFLLLIYFTGFIAGIALFIFSYLKFHDRGWFKSFVLTAVSVIVLYALFAVLLKINLFPGIIPELLFGG